MTQSCQTNSPAFDADRLLVERDLMGIQKPAQYLGGELNSVVKDEATVEVRLALAFPDTYEVGMSHTGIQILYQIVNSLDYAWAERCYMPLPDMEQLLRQRGAKLCSLEAKRPLCRFDVVGFSLQYELCMTNILAMLELGGIPLKAEDRRDSDPIIVGGGPYSYHPEAIAPFFDAFFLGDAEEGIVDLAATIRRLRNEGVTDREKLLDAIAEIEGIYLPSRFVISYCEDGSGVIDKITPVDKDRPMITRRLLANLDGSPFPEKPVVPNIKTVHNRLNVEVMRGCVRGCRFCQAGYLYRPQRERSPEEILRIIDAALPATGFEEISLLSLSTADYCSIVPLLKAVMGRYGDEEKVAISFPSTRVDALTPEVLSQVQRVRRTGFTLAPEGGTQRLRDVINKGVTDEQIVETCRVIFKMGWNGVKLYFMLGLPTETDADLEGIIDTARRVRAIPEAKGKDITVSVSTFVPKPHTPFQWCAQITPEETIRRQRLLADGLRRAKVNFRYHHSFSTFLEGVFCRGDRRLADVVLKAYELGCRLDAWDEHLSEEKWMEAFRQLDIDPTWFLRERAMDETLPWDHLSCGIPKSYFAKEHDRALRDKTTPDCLLKSCSICGACDYDTKRNVLWPRTESEKWLEKVERPKRPEQPEAVDPVCRIRLRYSKGGAARYFGHLEMTQIFHRAARRSGLPVAFSLGFHPMPRFSFGPPLQLGVASSEEYVDLYLVENFSSDEVVKFFNQTLPPDLTIAQGWNVPLRGPSLQESIDSYRYRVRWISDPQTVAADVAAGRLSPNEAALKILNTVIERKPEGGSTTIEPSAAKFSDTDSPEAIARDKAGSSGRRPSRKKGTARRFGLGEFIADIALSDKGLEFTLKTDPNRASPRLNEILLAISGLEIGDYEVEKVGSTFRPIEKTGSLPGTHLVLPGPDSQTVPSTTSGAEIGA